MLPLLAGLAGLCLMSNPQRKRRDRRRSMGISPSTAGARLAFKRWKGNPSGRVCWYRTRMGDWLSGILLPGESPDGCLHRMARNQTHVIVTKPNGYTPSEWSSEMRRATYVPQHTRRNPDAATLRWLRYGDHPPKAWWSDLPDTNGLRPYRISFTPSRGGKRIRWIRYGKNMDSTLELAEKAARREYPSAGAFSIESAQRTNPRRRKHRSRK